MLQKDQIKTLFKQTLPGTKAHERMAPPGRNVHEAIPSHGRWSAVMILLFLKNNEWHTVFIKRTHDGKSHSGQIAFPGGKKEPFDSELKDTALRECEEEIGIGAQEIEIVGQLSNIYIPPSNFIVSPFVGIVHTIDHHQISTKEVEALLSVPLSQLFCNQSKQHSQVVSSHSLIVHETPAYVLRDNTIIWGATAMMVSELEYLWQGCM
ncbi:MAG: CoA pyrophosphatase [Chitinophagaceae bacterium]